MIPGAHQNRERREKDLESETVQGSEMKTLEKTNFIPRIEYRVDSTSKRSLESFRRFENPPLKGSRSLLFGGALLPVVVARGNASAAISSAGRVIERWWQGTSTRIFTHTDKRARRNRSHDGRVVRRKEPRNDHCDPTRPSGGIDREAEGRAI